MDETARAVRAVIDRHNPGAVITWGPDGLTGHPDRRVASDVATQVFQQRAEFASPPQKFYYVAFPESRFRQSALPFRTVSDRWITTEIGCRAFLKQHFASQCCHRTQWGKRRIAQKEQMFAKTLDGRVFLRLALTDGPFRANAKARSHRDLTKSSDSELS
jgi:LmbE family N-acetylglucosaminyl deacetylase